jgi:hypothetical protein
MTGRLSYANVIATLALFVALGGSSYAAVELSRGEVKGKHLAANSVSSGKVKNRSLRARDFRAGQLPAGPQGPAGTQGPAGPQGVQGAPGIQGLPGPTQASVGGGVGALPADPFEVSLLSHPIQTRTAGRLFVYGKARLTVNCTNTFARTGLYVDGDPVPGSAYTHPQATPTPISIAGVTGELPAGNHTVVLATACDNGDWTGSSTGAESISAILLGGSL